MFDAMLSKGTFTRRFRITIRNTPILNYTTRICEHSHGDSCSAIHFCSEAADATLEEMNEFTLHTCDSVAPQNREFKNFPKIFYNKKSI